MRPSASTRIVVGTGPEASRACAWASRSRALALARREVAGVSTLDALAGGPGALPVIDARRREVFTLIDGEPVAMPPDRLSNNLLLGRMCVGDGAVRYREVLEAGGGARFRPTTASSTCRAGSPRPARDATSARPSWSSRSTCAPPTRTGRSMMIEFRKLKLAT